MAIRISPPLDDTKELLTQVMTHVLDNQRVAFCVPAGRSRNVLARIRVMISRKRALLEARGIPPKRFTLHSSVHPETHNGVRKECIVMWRTVSDSHVLTEKLEDLLGNG